MINAMDEILQYLRNFKKVKVDEANIDEHVAPLIDMIAKNVNAISEQILKEHQDRVEQERREAQNERVESDTANEEEEEVEKVIINADDIVGRSTDMAIISDFTSNDCVKMLQVLRGLQQVYKHRNLSEYSSSPEIDNSGSRAESVEEQYTKRQEQEYNLTNLEIILESAKEAKAAKEAYSKFKDLQLEGLQKVEGILYRHINELVGKEGDEKANGIAKIRELVKLLYGVDFNNYKDSNSPPVIIDLLGELSCIEDMEGPCLPTDKGTPVLAGFLNSDTGKSSFEHIREALKDDSDLVVQFPNSIYGNVRQAELDLQIDGATADDLTKNFTINYNQFQTISYNAVNNEAFNQFDSWTVKKGLDYVINGIANFVGKWFAKAPGDERVAKLYNLVTTRTVSELEDAHEAIERNAPKPPKPR